MGAVKTTTKELGDSRVRVEVEVAPETLERVLALHRVSEHKRRPVPSFKRSKGNS